MAAVGTLCDLRGVNGRLAPRSARGDCLGQALTNHDPKCDSRTGPVEKKVAVSGRLDFPARDGGTETGCFLQLPVRGDRTLPRHRQFREILSQRKNLW